MVMMGLTLTDKAQYDTVCAAQDVTEGLQIQADSQLSIIISIQKQFLN